MDYSTYSWADVTPIPQNDGPTPLAPIAYSDEFKQSIGLLRACMKCEEYSERALAVTAAVIEQNPAHYTAWEYRYQILKAIGKDVIPKEQWFVADVEPPVVEIGTWLDDICLENPKNYQVWNYRQHLEVPGSLEFYRGEHVFVDMVLADDSKNFHAWSHLKWAVRRGGIELFNTTEELKYSDGFLEKDVRNNSAWSFRFFVWDNDKDQPLADKDKFDDEVEFVIRKIDLAPQNESAWNYMSGLFARYKRDIAQLEGLCLQYASVKGDLPDINSMYALEMLGDIYAASGKVNEAEEALRRLKTMVPMRSGYWDYKLRKLAIQ